MIYGETGKLPLCTEIKKKMISYWSNLTTGKTDKIAYKLYSVMLRNTLNKTGEYKWLNKIKTILDETGFTYIWLQQTLRPSQKEAVKRTIRDQEIQNTQSTCTSNTSTKAKNYAHIKTTWETEHYMTILDRAKTKALIQFRTGNHKFPIEVGRYTQTPIANRTCPYCTNTIGDEYHYLLECTHFRNDRMKYIDTTYRNRPNMLKYKYLMQTKDTKTLTKLSTFIEKIIKLVK